MSSSDILMNGNNGTLLNGNTNLDYGEASTSSSQEPVAISGQTVVEQTYDSLFPALPEGNNFGRGATNYTQWTQSNLSNANGSDQASSNGLAKIMKVRSSKVTEHFTILSEERRDTRKICADIAKDTNTEIEMTSTSKGLTFLITGKSENVRESKKRISSELTVPTVYELEVPKEAYGQILGKNGNRLRDLENRSGAKITLPKDDLTDLIKIKGSRDAIELAIHEIQLISAEALSKCKDIISIEKEYHAFISGPFNETLHQLQQETGAKISIPPFSSNKSEIVITGDQNAINAAKERILEIYNTKKLNCEAIPIVIKKCQHKYIIGQKGSVLNEIFKKTGVSIEMPTDPDSEQIILRGEQDKLGSALSVLYDKAHSEIDLTLTAKSWIQRHLIGVKGSRLQALQMSFPNVHVSFSSDDDLIKLHGPRQETERAKEILLAEIDSVTQQFKIKEISVDPSYHRYIIGKGGVNIKKIREQTGASINIPEPNSPNANIITIEGNDETIARAHHELDKIIKKAIEKEAQVTKDLIIEQRFHSQLIGTKGANIKEIRDKFNVFISFPDSSDKNDKVSISGEKHDVEECFKHLTQLNKKLQSENFRLELPVNKQMMRYIIGSKGENIKKIRSETETRIDLPAEDSNSNTIIIQGEKSKCEKAKQMIQKIEKDELSLVQVDIIIPKKFHGSIQGKNFRIVRAIQEECDNVQITFPPQGSNSDKVTIRGSKEGVNLAKKQLVELSNDKQLNNYEENLICKFEFHKFLIGKNGSNINKIKNAHNVRVIFPKEDEVDQKNEVTIIGKKEQVQQARKELEAMISQLEKIVEITVNVPQKFHSHFIAKKLVNRIADENNNVSIQFPKADTTSPDADRVTIKGAKEFVESAKKQILEIVDDLQQQITHEIEIDSKYHGSVIGSRAINLVQIEQRHNVRINFPKRELTEDGKRAEKRSNKVQILGKPEACKRAAADLLDLVPIQTELQVPFEYHKNIIGKGGAFLRQLQDRFRVSCKMPKAEEQNDTIVLIGVPSDIEKAKQKIEDKVKELEQQKLDDEAKSFTIEIKTQASFIPKIIGKRGATINEIRKANDVNIQLSDSRPSRKSKFGNDDTMSESSTTDADKSESTIDESNASGSKDEVASIIVRGYEKNVKNAVKRLNKIIKELESFVVVRLHIDPENYSLLIGAKGKSIKKLIDQFKVDIKIPNDDSEMVTISGVDKNVQACKEEILKKIALIEEDDDLSMYKPPKNPTHNEIEIKPGKFVNSGNNNSTGFFVIDAPWSQAKNQPGDQAINTVRPDTNNVEDFPSMNVNNSSEAKNVVWVPK